MLICRYRGQEASGPVANPNSHGEESWCLNNVYTHSRETGFCEPQQFKRKNWTQHYPHLQGKERPAPAWEASHGIQPECRLDLKVGANIGVFQNIICDVRKGSVVTYNEKTINIGISWYVKKKDSVT